MSEASLLHVVAGTALVLGGVTVVVGLIRLCLAVGRRPLEDGVGSIGEWEREAVVEAVGRPNRPQGPTEALRGIVSLIKRNWVLTGLLVIVVSAGGYLRFDGLDEKSATHTEAIIPGISLPVEWSWPPLRKTAYDSFWWHFHSEIHPKGYYAVMWAWVRLMGDSVFSLRLPSALFGIGSIILVFGLGTSLYGRSVGLLSAVLLAFNGYHIYWSQYARPWAMGCFLGLLSAMLLVRLVQNPRNRSWPILYIGVTWLGAYTQVFVWPFLFAQILWILLRAEISDQHRHRVLVLQALVIILAASSLTHAFYQAFDVTAPAPSFAFILQYLSFGFLFEPDSLSLPARTIPVGVIYVLFICSVACIIRSQAVRGFRLCAQEPASDISNKVLILPAIGSVLIIIGLTTVAHGRHVSMSLTALIPIAAIIAPGFAVHVSASLRGHTKTFLRRWSRLAFVLFVVPSVIIFVVSFKVSLLANHAFLLFIPYLLILISAGAVDLSRNRILRAGLGLILVTAHIISITHFRGYPATGRDYKGLASEMSERMEEDDLVFVRYRDWVVTALLFYLDPYKIQFVADDYDAALQAQGASRVWLLYFDSVRWGPYTNTTTEMMEALSGFTLVDSVETRRSAAKLFVRTDAFSERK